VLERSIPDAGAPRSSLGAQLRSAGRDLARLPAWRVALLVTLVYGAIAFGPVVRGHAGDYAFVGRTFLDRSGTPAAIAEHAHATSRVGYDGQFALFIALDPTHAAASIDKPAYRYSHILYPVVSRAVALGNDDWVPVAMVLVNLLAIFAGTLSLGVLLRRRGEPPVLAAAFGFFPGMFVAFGHDLGDVLAYSLVPVAVLALRWDRWSRVALAGLVFAAAGLARESTLFFPAVLALWQVLQPGEGRRSRLLQASALSAVSFVPYVAWRLFVLAWLGPSHSVPTWLAPFPFQGIAVQRPWGGTGAFELLVVVVPGLLLAFGALGALRGRRTSPFVIALLVQVAVFVVFLPAASYADYNAAGRLQLGTVLAALFCASALRGLTGRFRQAVTFAIALGMFPAVLFALAVLGGGVS
jgi:hypothetical protein